MFVLLGSESLAFQLTDTVGTTKSKERGVRSSHLGATEQCGPQNEDSDSGHNFLFQDRGESMNMVLRGARGSSLFRPPPPHRQ